MTALASAQLDVVREVPVLRVTGEVDLSNTVELQEQLRRLAPPESPVVVLDLSGTSYLDSAGVSMLFRLAARARDTRRELRLVVPPSARIRAVLELTDLGRVVHLASSLTEALGDD